MCHSAVPGTARLARQLLLYADRFQYTATVHLGIDHVATACMLKALCSTRCFVSADEDVEYAEPNFLYTKSQTNDPGMAQLWGMQAAGGGANAVGAWAKGYTDCSDVVIGVIGENGLRFMHACFCNSAAHSDSST